MDKRSSLYQTFINCGDKIFYNTGASWWRHDTQYNDIQHNDIQQSDTQHNLTKTRYSA